MRIFYQEVPLTIKARGQTLIICVHPREKGPLSVIKGTVD
jgi:hypothetical protein